MKKFYVLLLIASMAVSNAMAQKVAMLKLDNPSATEQKAYDWFTANVTDGEFITISDLAADKLTTTNYSALWVMIDRVGISVGAANLPDGVTRQANNKIKPFVQDGGNVLFTNHATQLVNSIGRCSYAPGIFGSSAGINNADEWGIQACIGTLKDKPEDEGFNTNYYDHRSHAIFAGLEENDKYGHPTYALIGNGTKLDHNCMWDLNSYSDLTENPNKVKDFENKTNSVVLGTWQHVLDYCCAGIVEFNPTTDYKGKVLCVGLAAYDWTQSEYNTNFGQFTTNMINYLSGKTAGVTEIENNVVKSTATFNLAGQRVNGKANGIVIKNGKAVVVK